MAEWTEVNPAVFDEAQPIRGVDGLAMIENPKALAERDATATTAGRWINVGAMQVFTVSGTFTWPDGVTRAKVTLVGGGAGGASPGVNGDGRLGGGAGGVAIKYVTKQAASVAVTVAGTVGEQTNGQTTSWGSEFSATGGQSDRGGVGVDGDLNIGGGSASPGGEDDGLSAGGCGGSNAYGGGGDGGINIAGGGHGQPYGGGGGGSSSASSPGGNGAAGVCIVEY